MKREDALSVGEIIDQVLKRTGNTDQYYRQQASFLWIEVVGPEINRYTIRRYVDGDVMHVYMASASLKSELSFQSQSLVDKLNQLLGKNVISKIVIH